MKKLILILAFLSSVSFAQYFNLQDTIGTADTNYHQVMFHGPFSQTQFIYITVTLPNASDTLVVYAGTFLPVSPPTYDSFGNIERKPLEQQLYSQVALKDLYTYETVQVITGNTTQNRKYLLLYGYKIPVIAIVSKTNSTNIPYVIEVF